VALLCTTIADRVMRDRDMDLFRAVRNLAADTSVHEVERRELVDDAMRGMLGGLDRHSRYYSADEIAGLDRETTGEFRGIGIVFRRPVANGQILFPFPDSPAARAGIEVGDTILEVDGHLVEEMEPGGIQASLQRAGKRAVLLRIRDLAGAEREVEVVPERVVDPTIRHVRMVDEEESIGYLAILSFSHQTLEEFDRAMGHLVDAGMRALVIDLRGNPGGILDDAVQVANRFVGEGRLVATRTRKATQVTLARPEEALHAGMPLALLVDEGSASASEVLAGALQDHCAAVLVGQPTYGKGTVQTITPFDEYGARVKITTATYYTPAWRCIERDGEARGDSGIAPDVRCDLEDNARSAVHVFLSTYSPPPAVIPAIEAWEEREGLDLIGEAPADPQLEAAVALLRGEASVGNPDGDE